MIERVPGRTVETYRADLSRGVALLDLVATSSLAGSRSEARRLIGQGGIYVNDDQVTDASLSLTTGQLRPAGEYWPAAVWIGTKHRRNLVFLLDIGR